jgi:malate permease and related proteins
MLIFTVFAQVLLPILIMFGAGWLLDRKWNVDLGTVVKLNLNLFVPAFIFYQLTTTKLRGGDALKAVGYTISVVVILFLIAAIVAKCQRASREQTRSLQIATIFYNSANYGIPLMHLAFPGPAEAMQVFVILVQNVGNFTLGVFLVSSAKHTGFRALAPIFRQTSVWAVMIALTVRAIFGPVQPDTENMRWLWVPLKYFHDGLVAVALVTLGVQLSKSKAGAALPRLRWALGLRLLAGPVVGWALVPLFGFEGDLAKAMILSTAFPTAVNTALIAHEFKADTEYASGAVFWSTLFSMFTVTALIALLKWPGAASLWQ